MFRGYWHNQAATEEALDADGWLRTGDLGSLDDEGFLRVTGRKKELIVTAGGKNVAPAVLEDRLRAHPLISQCMVVGDNRPFIACLITLDAEALAHWKQQHGKPAGANAGRPGRRPRPARRAAGRRRRRQQGGLPGRVDPQVRDPAGGLHRRTTATSRRR